MQIAYIFVKISRIVFPCYNNSPKLYVKAQLLLCLEICCPSE